MYVRMRIAIEFFKILNTYFRVVHYNFSSN